MKKNKDWWRDEIKKVLDGESIYLTGTEKTEGMSKQEIIEWIVETVIEQEIENSFNEGYEEARKDMETGQMLVKDKEFNDLIGRLGEKLSKLNNKDNED